MHVTTVYVIDVRWLTSLCLQCVRGHVVMRSLTQSGQRRELQSVKMTDDLQILLRLIENKPSLKGKRLFFSLTGCCADLTKDQAPPETPAPSTLQPLPLPSTPCHSTMSLLCRGRLKLLAASLTAVALLTWLYLLAGSLEGKSEHVHLSLFFLQSATALTM